MRVEHVEVLVEEPSTEVALRLLLPRILENTSFQLYSHQGKNDLLQRLPARLRGYAEWLPPRWCIVVVVDRDEEECKTLKTHLEKMAADAHLITRTQTGRLPYNVVNRIAIEELEAWHFGDWEAVRAAYPRVPPTIPSKAKYRNPDGIDRGTWETFERILQRVGYFRSELRKLEAARTIAPYVEYLIYNE